MANLFDYVDWRGDLDFRLVPPNPVDALLFSTLSYINFSGIVPETVDGFISLQEAADSLFVIPDAEERLRIKNDIELLGQCARSKRFGSCTVGFYRDVLIPEQETQFAAMTFLLNDGSAFLAFRGTDYTMTGWKEDFNMSFQETVPAQLAAVEYTQEFARSSVMPLHICGHSKGGNLAVYAAAKCGPEIQKRIVGVHNNDGPGFHENMMVDPGYTAILPRICTYVPQSSVIGMLLEHEEPYVVVKSTQVGIMQHDPYSWTILGGGFVCEEDLTAESRFIDQTMKKWLADMTIEERNHFVDTVFEVISTSGVDSTKNLFRIKNLTALLKALKADEGAKKLITDELSNLFQAATRSQSKKTDKAEKPEKAEKPKKADKTEKPQKPKKADKTEKSLKAKNPEKTEKA